VTPDEVVARIDRQELVDLALKLGKIDSLRRLAVRVPAAQHLRGRERHGRAQGAMARVRRATPPASLSRFRTSSMRPPCMRASP
jgi:hypothetical protein